jgi:hypothetical protein
MARPPLESFEKRPPLESFAVTPKETKMPLQTGSGVLNAAKDVAVGFGKGAVRSLGSIQSIGTGALNTIYGKGAATGITALQSPRLQSKSRGEQIGGVLEFGAELGVGAVKGIVPVFKKAVQQRAINTSVKESQQLLEKISPKPTAKEAKLAQVEGRLVKGKEPTLFKAGTEPTILPTEKTIRASKTIQKEIPNASKMDDIQLFGELDKKITEKAVGLKPYMQASPIKPQTIQKINDDWTVLKQKQLQLADATEEANVIKLQQQFESRLTKLRNKSYSPEQVNELKAKNLTNANYQVPIKGSLDDLWETRKAYDDSIPENVKQAHAMSSESLQNKKTIWLENRAILNDAISKSEDGLGVVKNTFDEMSDLYTAKTGILSKTKVDKAALSKINQFWKDNPKIVGALKVGGAYGALKALGVPLP